MHSRRAFTLVETTIGLFVIAIAFIPIYNLFQFSSKGTTNNINEIIATNYASDLLNCVREIPYEKLREKNISDEEYDESRIEKFCSDAGIIPPKISEEDSKQDSRTGEPLYSRTLKITYYDGKPHGFLENLLNIFKKQQCLPSYLVKVTVKYPSASNKQNEPVTLYSLILE